MKMETLLIAVMLTIAQLLGAQTPQTPAPRNPARAEHHQHIMEMHQQEMEAMKADVTKMKASVNAMKAHLLTIKDVNEMARWQDNIEMWETLINHMDRMQKQMESMGPGMMGIPGMNLPPPAPPSPPSATKPE